VNRLVSKSGVYANGKREVCVECGRSFPHLAALIAHAEAEHASGAVRGDGGGGNETCPRCGARFSDVAALVEHVEREHERNPKRKSASQCRVS
jgi:uncharacterized C2H2 Zn-finger protein